MKIRTDFVTNSSSASYIVMMNDQAHTTFKKLVADLRMKEIEDWTKLDWGVDLASGFGHEQMDGVHAFHSECDHWPWERMDPPRDIWEDPDMKWMENTSTDDLLDEVVKELGRPNCKYGGYC
jgi:hypothetical protein